jgi:hypothetical protein
MNPARAKYTLIGVLLVCAVTPFVVQWKRAERLHALRETEREQAAELGALREQRTKQTATEKAREQAAFHTGDEIARLHGEIARLREAQASAEMRKRFRDAADPAIAAAYRLKKSVPKPLPAGSIPLGELQDAGQTSPEALLQTMRWALQHADLDALARIASFDPASRAKLNGWFAGLPPEEQAGFGTPERLFAAMLFNATFPFPAEGGLEVRELKQPTPDDALLHYRIRVPDGRVLQTEDFPARRGPGGWSYPVSEQTVNAYLTTFSYLPLSQREMLSQLQSSQRLPARSR